MKSAVISILFKRLVDGRFLVAICDVSGKGIAASLITAVLGGFFDGYTTSNTMKSFVRRLNRYLYDTFRLEYFITGIIIELDEDTGEATVCDMGHSYMLIMQGAKAPASRFRGRQPPAGGFPQPRSRDPGVPPEAGGRGGSLHGRGDRSDQSSGESITERRLWDLLNPVRRRLKFFDVLSLAPFHVTNPNGTTSRT